MHWQNKSFYTNGINNGVRFSTKSSFKNNNHKKIKLKKILAWVGIFLIIVFAFWFTKNVIQGLPDISNISSMVFSEATTIEDRNGQVLYKLYEENREYVPFSGISQNMINAIVAMEDQRYWEHNGLDPMGIVRAGFNNLLHPGRGMQGASTIQQQLLKNILLNKDQKRETTQQKIIRKLRELLLTSRLNGIVEKQIKKEGKDLSSDELRKEMKDKVLELYLNYIPFGNNAFGVEAASKTYFDKSAKDIDIMEASVLASIPKSASIYNPYRNRARLMGEFAATDSNGNKISITGEVLSSIQAQVSSTFASISIKNKDNNFITVLESLGTFSVSGSGWSYVVKYSPGRKDSALTRMYEDGYITENELKQAFLESITYTFRKNKVDMLAPHFVQWIIEELEKQYDKETLFKGGIVVKTSLDYEMQKLAEESMLANMGVLQENGANNSAMIYLDSKNGDVLAYAGSINYFDEKIEGQNDMIRRPRQSWSSIKPLIYALWFEKLPITLDTPIFDIPFQIGKDKPNNADDKFYGMLPLKYALAQSRNIPAVKMFTALGWEEVAKPFLQSLGISGVQSNVEYGYTLALWAAEITMLQLAKAYTYLSAVTPAEINPILEIRSRDGSLIYQKEVVQKEKIIEPGISYLIWKILSDPGNRLAGWVSKFNVKGLSLALKTGTSNAKTDKGNRPRDWWLAGYNASKVLIMWAGNANGTPMNRNAFGGTIHANPMKDFFTKLVNNNYITNDLIKPVDVSNVQISKISGKTATDKTPAALVVDTMYYIRGVWLWQDDGAEVFDYDISCNGAQSQYTPISVLRKGYLITPTSFMPGRMDLEDITNWWKIASTFTGIAKDSAFSSGNVMYNYNTIFVTKPTQGCEGREVKEDTTIKVNLIKPSNTKVSSKFVLWYDVAADKWIKSVMLFADGQQVAQFPYRWTQKTINELQYVSTSLKDGDHAMELIVMDKDGYSNKKSFTLTITTSDTQAPVILEDKTQIKQEDGKYQVSIILDDDLSYVDKWTVSVGITKLVDFNGSVASFTIDALAPVTVVATDAYGNKVEKTINLTI